MYKTDAQTIDVCPLNSQSILFWEQCKCHRRAFLNKH